MTWKNFIKYERAPRWNRQSTIMGGEFNIPVNQNFKYLEIETHKLNYHKGQRIHKEAFKIPSK